jgi:hypothetical protein
LTLTLTLTPAPALALSVCPSRLPHLGQAAICLGSKAARKRMRACISRMSRKSVIAAARRGASAARACIGAGRHGKYAARGSAALVYVGRAAEPASWQRLPVWPGHLQCPSTLVLRIVVRASNRMTCMWISWLLLAGAQETKRGKRLTAAPAGSAAGIGWGAWRGQVSCVHWMYFAPCARPGIQDAYMRYSVRILYIAATSHGQSMTHSALLGTAQHRSARPRYDWYRTTTA